MKLTCITEFRIWVCMCVEINLGIICACLSGVKPVLQVISPRLFGSSNRSKDCTKPSCVRSRPPKSHQFQTLPGKSQDKHIEHIEELTEFGTTDKSNVAWASSNGHHDGTSEIPANSIAVEQVVIVEEEDSGTITPRSNRGLDKHDLSDSSSEKWILHDRPNLNDA